MIRLPLLIRRPANPFWYLVLWAPYIALYQISNRLLLFEPRQLPLSTLDNAIPFVPELLPLYVAYIPFFWWTLARSETDEAANQAFYATYFQMLMCLPLFVFMPVRMPRELFYGADAYGLADAFWRWFDAPHNCLPSLHAANGLLLAQLNWRRRARWVHTFFAVAIVASALLVKQHYVVDIVAGGCVYLLARRFLAALRLAD
ncbi:MAG TPA: phosphatase PAP2 family protein, partial [Terriglobales bacterium]|nr:phosphatase PAP2 family protein [Terriglobales bacterium]